MDSFFGIGPFELIFILIFALIFLGPERLPAVVRDVVGFVRKIQLMYGEITTQLTDEFSDLRELDPSYQLNQMLKEEEEEEESDKQKTDKQKTDKQKTDKQKTDKQKTDKQKAEDRKAGEKSAKERELDAKKEASKSLFAGQSELSEPIDTTRDEPAESESVPSTAKVDQDGPADKVVNGAGKLEPGQTVEVAKIRQTKKQKPKIDFASDDQDTVEEQMQEQEQGDPEDGVDGSQAADPLDPARLGPVRKFGPDQEQKNWVMPGTEKKPAEATESNETGSEPEVQEPRAIPKQRSDTDQISPASAHFVTGAGAAKDDDTPQPTGPNAVYPEEENRIAPPELAMSDPEISNLEKSNLEIDEKRVEDESAPESSAGEQADSSETLDEERKG